MKFDLRPFAIALLCLGLTLGSCAKSDQGGSDSSSGGDQSAEAGAHGQVVNTYFNSVTAQDWDAVRSLMTDDFVYHSGGHDLNLDQTIAMYQMYSSNMDMSGSVDDVVESGDKVAYRLTVQGSNIKGMGEMPASDKTVSVASMGFLRFDGDKIAEEWEVFDEASMLRQLGVLPPMEMPSAGGDAGTGDDTAAAESAGA